MQYSKHVKYTGAVHWARCQDSKDELDMAFAPEGAPRTNQVKLEVKPRRRVNMRKGLGGKTIQIDNLEY